MESIRDRGYRVEDENTPEAIKILKKHGFTNIIRMPRLSLYDFEAEKDGKTVYIEFRCRSPTKAPTFTFSKSKLDRLKELKKKTGRDVYILLLRKPMYKLVEIDDFPGDLRPFYVVIGGKRIKTNRFPARGELTGEEILKIVNLKKRGLSNKDIAEEVGCSVVTVRKILKLPDNELKKLVEERKYKPNTKREKPTPRLKYTITVRVDEGTYKWLQEKKELMKMKDLSSTVRELLVSTEYMLESGGVVLPEPEVIDEFIRFLSKLKYQNKKDLTTSNT